MNDVSEELLELSQQLRLAKLSEELARKKRVGIEDQIALLIPGKEIGQETVTLANGTKIVVKRGLNYKADLEKIEACLYDKSLPVPIESKTTRAFDVAGYEWYRVNYPATFVQMTEHVTVTPKKVSVVLKPAEGK